MQTIIISVVVVAVIGVVAGLGLSVASVVMAVPVDEKTEKIRAVLPGANCGACGYSGCDGYAQALADGAKVLTLCTPGGAETAQEIGAILGMEAGAAKAKGAVVHCRGNCDNTGTAYDYDGITSCVMANQLAGGPGECKYGCIGLADCVSVCEYDAIKVCNGVAVVDRQKCVSCRKCVGACPKGLISIEELEEQKAFVYCMNRDKGAVARKVCKVSCIGCMKCQKACEFDAVNVSNFLAAVNLEKCTNCGKCIDACPTKCIMNLIN